MKVSKERKLELKKACASCDPNPDGHNFQLYIMSIYHLARLEYRRKAKDKKYKPAILKLQEGELSTEGYVDFIKNDRALKLLNHKINSWMHLDDPSLADHLDMLMPVIKVLDFADKVNIAEDERKYIFESELEYLINHGPFAVPFGVYPIITMSAIPIFSLIAIGVLYALFWAIRSAF